MLVCKKNVAACGPLCWAILRLLLLDHCSVAYADCLGQAIEACHHGSYSKDVKAAMVRRVWDGARLPRVLTTRYAVLACISETGAISASQLSA